MMLGFIKKVILEDLILKHDKSIKEKIIILRRYYMYNKNLRKHLRKNDLYLINDQTKDTVNFTNQFSQDFELIKKITSMEIKSFLKKSTLKNTLDFSEPIDFKQLGPNFIFIQKPIRGLWNVGLAKLFLPTKINQKNKFQISFFSIAPLTVTIYFEGKKVVEKKYGKFEEKSIEFSVSGENVLDEISELAINTDQFWFPNLITNGNEIIPIGIGLKSISVS